MRLRSRYLIFALLSLVAIAITAEAGDISNGASAISANRDSSDDIKGKTSELNPYKPTYIILQAGTPDPRSKNIIFTKFQINIKLPVAEPLFFAYTLKTLWDITEDSAPFKDYSHNPEFFLDIDNSNVLKIGQIGVEHESNGKSGEDSRSWNRVYWEPRFVYNRPAGKILGFDIIWEGKGLSEKGIDKNTGKVLVEIDPNYFRPSEVEILHGDPSKAKAKLNWEPKIKFDNLVKKMVLSDLKRLQDNGVVY